jgi:hypothetical protein
LKKIFFLPVISFHSTITEDSAPHLQLMNEQNEYYALRNSSWVTTSCIFIALWCKGPKLALQTVSLQKAQLQHWSWFNSTRSLGGSLCFRWEQHQKS